MRPRRVRGAGVGIAGAVLCLCLVSILVVAPSSVAKTRRHAASSTPQVLYVGTFDGVTPSTNDYSTIQAAVNAAKPGDWILIAPGDYHEDDDASITAPNRDTEHGWYGGVLIKTNDITLMGMNRDQVIVDGTKPNDDGDCSDSESDQNFVPVTSDGKTVDLGQNGIVVWANGVSVNNLTVCNYLAGAGDAGNEIWWNGGDGLGKVTISGYSGSYLTATSTYFVSTPSGSNPDKDSYCDTCALYGIFSSNSSGGALGTAASTVTWSNVYASNFADSGAYIGACQDECNASIDDAEFQYNALGYSGTNSGGELIIENSTFSDNKEGLDTNTALTGDPPPPQNGECPGDKDVTGSQPVVGTNPVIHSCWVFGPGNVVEDNNDPDVPIEGTAGLGPTTVGQTVSGGRNDVVMDNTYEGNEGYGLLFVPYPDSNLKSDGKTCTGEGGFNVAKVFKGLGISGVDCIFDPQGNEAIGNTFTDNATLHNGDNADLGNLLIGGDESENCFVDNTDDGGPATNADVKDGYSQLASSTCGADTAKSGILGSDTDENLLIQAECDAGIAPSSYCSGAKYPTTTQVVMEPLPGASSLTDPESSTLPSMNPCLGLPAALADNAWCSNGNPIGPT